MGGVLPICSTLFAGENDWELHPSTKANGDEKCGKILLQRLVLTVLIGVDLKGKGALSAPSRKQRTPFGWVQSSRLLTSTFCAKGG
jgi:hypothetical protein